MMTVATAHLESTRTPAKSCPSKQHELGQFLTPYPVAEFMASLFESKWRSLSILDAGAGAGMLSDALVKRICAQRNKPESISITAFELDETVIEPLSATLHRCQRECERNGIRFSSKVFNEDFIAAAVPMARDDLFGRNKSSFNAAIVNPPYRKISSDSSTRLLLRSAGIETSNLYTAFVALICKLLTGNGELVSITPRSFCNGPYFKPFRRDFLEMMSLRRLHLFESRSAAFKGDDVLQENIIIHAVKSGTKPDCVAISSSSGMPGSSVAERNVNYFEVVSPDDTEQFIHLSENEVQDSARAKMEGLSASLADLGLAVSTGRVVDFRAKEYLCQNAEPNTVPLIYPCHFNGGFVHWPKETSRKPNAIVSNEQTRDLLVPAGVYVLVKRFTSKEERKRVVACIYDSHQNHARFVGFENHLNYFHITGRGLPMTLAKGLTAFLNSTVVDVYFRLFNGHTQVNATDLRNISYPSKEELEELGRKIVSLGIPQAELDALVERELF